MSQSNQQLHFLTGKGGVGKSTIAAALALHLSRKGRRVLLVELNEKSHYGRWFQLPIGYQPTQWQENLWISCWDGEACLREYLRHYVRIDTIVDLFFKNVVMKTFIQAAPALREISILGKATSGIRGIGPTFDYDHVVIDAYATGHFRALMRAPRGLAQAVPFGPMGEQSRQIESILRNPKYCQYMVVTLPELLPVLECRDLAIDLKNEWTLESQILLNKFWEIPFSGEDFDRLRKSLEILDPKGVPFLDYLENIRERQNIAQNQLRSLISDWKSLPIVFGTSEKSTLIEALAERFSANDLVS